MCAYLGDECYVDSLLEQEQPFDDEEEYVLITQDEVLIDDMIQTVLERRCWNRDVEYMRNNDPFKNADKDVVADFMMS